VPPRGSPCRLAIFAHGVARKKSGARSRKSIVNGQLVRCNFKGFRIKASTEASKIEINRQIPSADSRANVRSHCQLRDCHRMVCYRMVCHRMVCHRLVPQRRVCQLLYFANYKSFTCHWDRLNIAHNSARLPVNYCHDQSTSNPRREAGLEAFHVPQFPVNSTGLRRFHAS
jgi:hypothetical protein